MQSIQLYNNLDNRSVSRKEIERIIAIAKDDEQTQIVERLTTLLKAYPQAINFTIEITENLQDIVPDSFLTGLDYEPETDGLNKAVSSAEIYQTVTDKVIEMVKKASAGDYKQKWKGGVYGKGYLIPFNFVSKKRYKGINVVLLSEFEPLENPYFLTFKQVEELGGTIKKGSHGRIVVYYTELHKVEDRKRNLSFSSYDRDKVKGYANENNIESGFSKIPILKYYNVFNGKDIDGIDFDLDNFKVGFIDIEKPADEANRMPIPEAIIKNYPAPQPKLRFGGNRAYYTQDVVTMPYLSDFETVEDYYRTLFHEFSHSTGIYSRLDRNMKGSFGSKPYAFEELVAELGAVFLSAEAGIMWGNSKQHAGYLKSWNQALTYIKDDTKFILKASALAQKSADFILQFDQKGDPLYFKDIKPSDPVQPKKVKVSKTTKPINKKTEAVKPKQGDQLELNLAKPKASKSISDLKKLGFVCASDIGKEEPKDVFVLPGQIGKFLQKIQPHKALILIKGTKHTSKSQIAMQIANGFGEKGDAVAYIDYEQGGVESKDTIDSINRNTSLKGRENIAVIGFLEFPLKELKELCKYCSIIIADSVTDLRISADQLNDLRVMYPKVIWCFISQVKENGEMYGGHKMAHNPTMIIECHPSENPALRYATLEKNRGNDLNLMYSIYHKKLIKSIPVEKLKKTSNENAK